MKTKLFMILPLLAPLAIGCGDSTGSDMAVTPGADMTKAAGGDMAMAAGGDMAMAAGGDMAMAAGGDMAMAGFPASPAIGDQIDRMGRPGVNTALTNPFGITMGMTSDAVKDAYNKESDPAKWDTTFSPYIAANLPIFDGLDTVCGNQAGAGMALNKMRYATLTAALVDDELYVNTASGTCGQYLGVELAALGIANMDCGGRTPLEDTIDWTYTLLATGDPAKMVTDGISKDADNAPPMPLAFPFLGAPN